MFPLFAVNNLDKNYIIITNSGEVTLMQLNGGGGGVQAYHFGKKEFELGVGGEGQDTSRNFEGSFGSIRILLPM